MSFDNLDLNVIKALMTNKKHAVDFANENGEKLFTSSIGIFGKQFTDYVRLFKEIPTLNVLEQRNKKLPPKALELIKEVWNAAEAINYNIKEYPFDLEKIRIRYAESKILSLKSIFESIEKDNINIGNTLSTIKSTVQSINELKQVKAYEKKTLKDSVSSFIEEFKAKQNDESFDKGLKTGYSYLDHVTDGLRPGELLLIGAESGSGKSLLMLNIALQMWLGENDPLSDDVLKDNYTFKSTENNIMYFSLEMPFKPCLNRVLSRLSQVPSKAIRKAKIDQEQGLRLRKVLKFMQKYTPQFEIIDIPRGVSMEMVESVFEETKANYNFIPNIIVIDYLGLMEYEGKDMDDWLKLGKIAEKIHEFARVHNCIVISAVQLNRSKGGKETEDRVGLHRVGRSAMILQNANIAIQIETRPNEKNYPDMYYHIIKNRDGELGRGKLIKNLSCLTLIDDPDENDFSEADDISEKMKLIEL